jgi:hypothetical protein
MDVERMDLNQRKSLRLSYFKAAEVIAIFLL